MVVLALIIAALVLFIIAALGVGAGRFNLLAAGFACATLAYLLQRL